MIIVYHIHEKKISRVYVGRIQSDVRNASLRGSDFDDILPCKKEMAGDPSYRNATETATGDRILIFLSILIFPVPGAIYWPGIEGVLTLWKIFIFILFPFVYSWNAQIKWIISNNNNYPNLIRKKSNLILKKSK